MENSEPTSRTNGFDELIPVLSMPACVEILDALKPAYSTQSSHRRQAMLEQMEAGQHAEAIRQLQSSSLLERVEGVWSIPPPRRRLAYQIATVRTRAFDILDEVAQAGARQAQGTWVDIACGSGGLLRAAQSRFHCAATGIDVDAEALKLARTVDGVEGRAIDYHVAMSHGIPLEADSCDVVTSIVAFQHFWVRETLAEMRRIARPQCVLVLRLQGAGYYLDLANKYLRRKQLPVYATRCLWHGVRLSLGWPQNVSTQDGWLKFETPLFPSWMVRQLEHLGFRVLKLQVLDTYQQSPVFFNIVGILEA